MPAKLVDITKHFIPDLEEYFFPERNAAALALYWDSIVVPALTTLNAELDRTRRSKDSLDWFFIDPVADLHKATLGGFLLAVQSMWEREVRALLTKREIKLHGGAQVRDIQRGPWEILQQHFERLLGLPLRSFDSFNDLLILQNVANALRHGKGSASTWVQHHHPELAVITELVDGTENAQPGQIGTPEDRLGPALVLREQVLHQMIDAVRWFWLDMECIRIHSFSAKSHHVELKLADWPNVRASRAAARVWTPH